MPSPPKWLHKFEIKPGSWVFVPTDGSKDIGYEIKDLIESRWTPPRYYYHLRSGGHVEAVKSHTDGNWSVHLDLKSFFNSINKSRIARTLKNIYGYEKARKIAIDSTVRLPGGGDAAYVLPFGFVQSPVLASICLYKSKLGRILRRLNAAKGVVVSVYVDDIIISAQDLSVAEAAMKEVVAASERSRLPLNPRKTEGPAKTVTAFNIELSNSSLEIDNKRFEEFKEMYRDSESYSQLAGILGYVESVNRAQADGLV